MTDAAQEALVEMVAVDLAASLAAAISLLEKGGKAAKKAAASDKMFDMMLADYRASLDRARAFFKGKPKCGLTSAMTDLTDEQITAGWLPHDGGPCPVNPLTTVEIMLRGGDGAVSSQLTTGGGKPGQGQPCIILPFGRRAIWNRRGATSSVSRTNCSGRTLLRSR